LGKSGQKAHGDKLNVNLKFAFSADVFASPGHVETIFNVGIGVKQKSQRAFFACGSSTLFGRTGSGLLEYVLSGMLLFAFLTSIADG